jgi:hypothetical protein
VNGVVDVIVAHRPVDASGGDTLETPPAEDRRIGSIGERHEAGERIGVDRHEVVADALAGRSDLERFAHRVSDDAADPCAAHAIGQSFD